MRNTEVQEMTEKEMIKISIEEFAILHNVFSSFYIHLIPSHR